MAVADDGSRGTWALYSRRGCTLCEEAIAQLESEVPQLDFVVRDIDATPELRAQFAHRLPVLLDASGMTVFEMQCDLAAVRRAL